MPSGWTTSGIDWGNLRNNRTEDIVYHLHKACYERFFYYYGATSDKWRSSVIKNNSPLPPNLKNFKMRTDNAMLEIRQILNRIYSIDESYALIDNNISYLVATKCMFKKDYEPNVKPVFNAITAPDPADSRYQGLNTTEFKDNIGGLQTLDISQGGDLENIAGGDLSFLRDLSINRRIDISDLYKIYNILSTPQDCLCDTSRKFFNVSYNDYAYQISAITGFGDGGGTQFLKQFTSVRVGSAENNSGNSGIPSNINNTIDEMYADTGDDPYTSSAFGDRWAYVRYQHTSGAGWTSSAYQNQNVSMLGGLLKNKVDSSEIDIDNINVNYYTVDYEEDPPPNDPFYTSYNTYPLAVYGNNGYWKKRSHGFSSTNVNGDYYSLIGTDKITSGIPTLPVDLIQRKEGIVEAHIRSMNIDSINGLLEYYNE